MSIKQPSHNTGSVGLTSLDVNDHLMSSPHPRSVVVAITCKEERTEETGMVYERGRWKMTQRTVKERIMWNGRGDGRSRGPEGGNKQKKGRQHCFSH